MGNLSNLVNVNNSSTARKMVTCDWHDDGFEAPRNSLELQVESLLSNCAERFILPYGYGVTDDWSQRNSVEAPMKKLISEEISRKPNNRHSTPSVVARLMGVDMLPFNSEPVRQPVERKSEIQTRSFANKEYLRKSLGSHVSYDSNSSTRKMFDPFYHKEDNGTGEQKSSLNSRKPKPREHPQEEELQKFKKEFEAWQAARFKKYSKEVEYGSITSQLLAQEELNKENMAFYAGSMRLVDTKKPMEKISQAKTEIPRTRGSPIYKEKKNESFVAGRDCSGFSGGGPILDFQRHALTHSDVISDIAASPSKIVILRPGPNTLGYSEESWASSPGISQNGGSIEDFLEEVKERLKNELQGKPSKRSTVVRGGGIETPYSEKPLDAKEIAQHIAEQARESATGNIGTTLARSASTRSYRSETQFSDTGSPDSINRDTRRFLTEKLRNVMREHQDVNRVVRGNSRSPMSNDERTRSEQSGNSLDSGKRARHFRSLTNESEIQSRSFRRDPDDNVLHQEVLSPRNLVRSLSAPVSGTSFGKLLLEDRHMLTGAHIRRKHEVIGKITVNVKNQKKEKFNLREKVSNFRYSLTLRGRLFGKKVHSEEKSHGDRYEIKKDILTGPTSLINFYDRLENSTEVPPSPASICSSAHEEFWRAADYSSQTSTSDIHSIDDSMMPQVFRDISSNLNELRRQLNQLETEGSEATITEEQQDEVEMAEIEDEDKAYIRDLLVTSGFYDGSCHTLSRWDPFGKPISHEVFEEVVESYVQRTKDDEGSTKHQGDNLKILFDLLNETLSTIPGTTTPASRFTKKANLPELRPLRGNKLLDHVWETIQDHLLYPPPEGKYYHTVDGMVARDLQSSPWSKLIDDEVNAVGKEIEYHITGELIEEVVKDMQAQFIGENI